MKDSPQKNGSEYPGSLFIIAAASGSGKTSLVNEIISQDNHIMVSVSHTTRPQREYEKDSVHYFFVNKNQFESMIEQNVFLEYAEVFGHYYGTSRAWVEKQLQAGIDVILEIDWQGAKQVTKQFSDSVSIFILPPSSQSLRERLEKRNSDSAEIIEKRLDSASEEIAHLYEFDFLVINDDFYHALADIRSIIHARRLRTSLQIMKHCKLLEDLLQNQ